jgi:hypothetical protein
MAYEKKGGHGGAREGAGQPEWAPTEKDITIINALAACGVPQVLIEIRIGHCWTTIKKHLPDLVIQEQKDQDGAVVHSLWINAVVFNNVTAQIYWTKARMGWREAKENPAEGVDNTEFLSELAKVMKGQRENLTLVPEPKEETK